jgi:hypothetical protein
MIFGSDPSSVCCPCVAKQKTTLREVCKKQPPFPSPVEINVAVARGIAQSAQFPSGSQINARGVMWHSQQHRQSTIAHMGAGVVRSAVRRARSVVARAILLWQGVFTVAILAAAAAVDLVVSTTCFDETSETLSCRRTVFFLFGFCLRSVMGGVLVAIGDLS